MKHIFITTLLIGAALLGCSFYASAGKNVKTCSKTCPKCNGTGVVEVQAFEKQEPLTDEQILAAVVGQTFTGKRTTHWNGFDGFTARQPMTKRVTTTFQFEAFKKIVYVTVDVKPTSVTSPESNAAAYRYSNTYTYEVKDGLVIINDFWDYQLLNDKTELISKSRNVDTYPIRLYKK